ncbi:MAG: glycosyltransferase family 9 protein [Ardenticatenaceae bacterium]|nr:glycosyltransferase family 9 protein [Ardenticatenaceae bacterium]
MRDALRAGMLRGIARGLKRTPPLARSTPPRLLLIRPDHLGDVLFLTPALRAVREAQPNAQITALVGPWAAPLLARNPDLDAVETLDFPWFDRRPRRGPFGPYRRLQRAAAGLRGRFDVALILRFDHWWGGWLAAAAGIPYRLGYATRYLVPFLTEAVPYQPGRHEVLQNLTLTSRLGTPAEARPQQAPLRYVLDPAALAVVERWTSWRRPLIAVHPGSGAPVKLWSPAKWAALAEHVVTTYGGRVILTGAPGAEAEQARAIAIRAGVAHGVAAGETSLETLAALYSVCDLVVGPDTGPLHLAVAVGTPTVHLYGPNSPQTFGPWGDPARHRVLTQALACQFCHRLDWGENELADHPCVHELPLASVVQAVDQVLAP